MCRQALAKSLPNMESFKSQVKSWTFRRNVECGKVNWQFTTTDARVKLKRLYPTIVWLIDGWNSSCLCHIKTSQWILVYTQYRVVHTASIHIMGIWHFAYAYRDNARNGQVSRVALMSDASGRYMASPYDAIYLWKPVKWTMTPYWFFNTMKLLEYAIVPSWISLRS